MTELAGAGRPLPPPQTTRKVCLCRQKEAARERAISTGSSRCGDDGDLTSINGSASVTAAASSGMNGGRRLFWPALPAEGGRDGTASIVAGAVCFIQAAGTICSIFVPFLRAWVGVNKNSKSTRVVLVRACTPAGLLPLSTQMCDDLSCCDETRGDRGIARTCGRSENTTQGREKQKGRKEREMQPNAEHSASGTPRRISS